MYSYGMYICVSQIYSGPVGRYFSSSIQREGERKREPKVEEIWKLRKLKQNSSLPAV